MRELGFSIVQAGHPAYVAQPCAMLVGASCSVYANRPQNCRGFRCRVLQRLETGELGFEEAQATIRQAISLRASAAQLASLRRLLDDEFKPKKLPGDEL